METWEREECAYCGGLSDLTRDHVPPQGLFSKPRPANLITVPACLSCNREYSKHDEYFRLVMTLGIDRAKFPKENAASVEAINNLGRPQSIGFALSLLERNDPETRGQRVDKDRIGIVLHRIIRGIFYHHTRIRLPKSASFNFTLVSESTERMPVLRSAIELLAINLTTIGDGIFRYAFVQASLADGFDTVWLLKFYDHRAFLCQTSTNRD